MMVFVSRKMLYWASLLATDAWRLQGKVYDVTGNKAYQPGGSYHGKPCLFFF
jgi:hypothetical protein